MMKKILLLIFFATVIVIAGCTDKHEYPAELSLEELSGKSSCVRCHASEASLRMVADEDDDSGSSTGEG